MLRFLGVILLFWIMVLPAQAQFVEVPHPVVPVEVRDEAVFAMAKIDVYTRENGYFVKKNSVTGPFINNSGRILTAYDQIELGEDIEEYYRVCIHKTVHQSPNDGYEYEDPELDCQYTGRKISVLKDANLAIIEAMPIPQYSSALSFNAMELILQDETNMRDNVVMMGYKDKDFETPIKQASSIIEIEEDINEDIWYKVGSTNGYIGGFTYAVDHNGKLLAVKAVDPTEEFVGSYLANVLNYETWLDKYIFPNFGEFKLPEHQEDFVKFLKKQYDLSLDQNTFEIEDINLKIDKILYWDFILESENELEINYLEDSKSGSLKMRYYVMPYNVPLNDVLDVLPLVYAQNKKTFTVLSSTGVSLRNFDALLVEAKLNGLSSYVYYVTVGNYIIELEYDEGADNKDYDEIQTMIDSLRLDTADPYFFSEIHQYISDANGIKLGPKGNWVIDQDYITDDHVVFYNTEDKPAVIEINVEPLPVDLQKLSDEFYYDILLGSNSYSIKKTRGGVGSSVYVTKGELKVDLSETIKNVIKVDYRISGGHGLNNYVREYILRHDNKSYSIRYVYYISDQEAFTAGQESVDDLLNTLIIDGYTGEKVVEPAPIVNEGSTGDSASNPIEVATPEPVPVELLAFSGTKDVGVVHSTKGKIMLQIEGRGEAWYVNPDDEKRYYLGKPVDAFDILRKFGKGITNQALAKIPIGHIDNSTSNSNVTPDKGLIERFKGYFLIQVEEHGEAWYVNPNDNKRYYLGTPAAAWSIMKFLGIGITNNNLANISM